MICDTSCVLFVYCIWVCYSGILYQNCVLQWCWQFVRIILQIVRIFCHDLTDSCCPRLTPLWQCDTFLWNVIILLKKERMYLVWEMWWNHLVILWMFDIHIRFLRVKVNTICLTPNSRFIFVLGCRWTINQYECAIMVVSCVMGCTSRWVDSSLSFYRIPKEEKQLLLNLIKRKHWAPSAWGIGTKGS